MDFTNKRDWLFRVMAFDVNANFHDCYYNLSYHNANIDMKCNHIQYGHGVYCGLFVVF